MDELFLGEQHPLSGRQATFADDGISAWLYFSEPNTGRVVADAWAYNRGAPPPVSQLGSYRPAPPPAAEGYAGPGALCADPSVHSWALLWSVDGESVAVLRDGLALAFIARAGRSGYCRFLAHSGPWGLVWDEALFREVMGDLAERDPGDHASDE
jgi:hypothetical protein